MSLFICQIKLVLATVAFSSTKYRLEGNDEGFQSKETWKIIHIWPHSKKTMLLVMPLSSV